MKKLTIEQRDWILSNMNEWKSQYCNSDEYNDAKEDCIYKLKKILNTNTEESEQREKKLKRLASSIEDWGSANKEATSWNEADVEELIDDTQSFINAFRNASTEESKPIKKTVLCFEGEEIEFDNLPKQGARE